MNRSGTNVIVICGPTASGKSSLAADVARRTGGTVINADSMQLYRGLPVLTAVPAAAERGDVPHALYEVLDPAATCSARIWRDIACESIRHAHAQGAMAILAGGTGFYLNALLKGLSPIPDIPAEVRQAAITDMAALGLEAFYARLAQQDPVTAARLDPANRQRVVRAWEVLAHTGKGLAHWQSLPAEKPPTHFSFFIVTLLPARADLYARCDARFDAMLDNGALEEVAALHTQIKAGHVPPDAPLTQALGYRPLAAYLDGLTDLQTAAATARQDTRRYAKRQTTWFRHQIRPDLTLDTPCADSVLAKIL